MPSISHAGVLATILMLLSAGSGPAQSAPNVLFIAIDDLNDWIGCLGGHPQTLTPNLDRLAASGVLFTNAHCAGAACNPSRTAVMTGLSPHRSGLYDNRQKMREVLPDAVLLPQHFRNHGYRAAGSGKLLHYFIDAHSWDEYFPPKEKENPFPRTLDPANRPVSLPRGGPWQYVETDWAALQATDEEFGGDWLVTKWVGEQLARRHEQPFFLACGIYRPHEPWFVPAKYFEPFPLDGIQLPPGYREDDLDDLPPAGKARGPNRYFAHIRAHGQWKAAIQAYLASIHFADAMLGRVLDALDHGPNAANTIVVLWSDHGWHLGEKEHWQKYTAWRAVTRVPLMMRVPNESSTALPEGTRAGSVCDQPVDLLSLYRTTSELAGIEIGDSVDGPSLVPLLSDANAAWPHVAITHLAEPGSYGLSARGWRYIHYANGDEELYHIEEDPYEWHNLAPLEQHAAKLAELRKLRPTDFAPKQQPSLEAMPELAWVRAQEGRRTPASRPDGDPFDVVFVNRRREPVELFWMTREGDRRSYGIVAPGATQRQQTRPGAVWQVAVPDGGDVLGHFEVGDRTSRAIVPAEESRAPNVVVIVSDDQGFADIGFHNPAVYSPNLDALAAGGLRFSHHYAMPQCTPTRVALLTGRYPGRFGNHALVANNTRALPPGTATMASVLRERGYSTHLVGKWHLGSTPKDGPNQYGFDQSYGSLGGAVGMYDHRYRSGPFETTWHRNGEFIPGAENGVHTTDLCAREAVRVIEAAGERPFFLYVGFHAVHTPLDERGGFTTDPTQLDPDRPGRWLHEDEIPWFHDPEGRIQRERDPNKRLLLAAVHHLDDAIGRIVTALDRSGLRDDTLIIFTSDNGPQVSWPGGAYPDDLRLREFSQPHPFRGLKTDVYEGGVRVPAFCVWPGHVEPGIASGPTHVVDWLPTVSRITGSNPPADLDGVDLSGVMLRGVELAEREIYEVWGSPPNRFALRLGRWKLVRYGKGEPSDSLGWLLFDLDMDPAETHDVAGEHPDLVQDLLRRLTAQRSRDRR
ncbi:MAG: sulfatase-like hydrolase/transferase [Planctomycetota bacterium]